jgi:hypothetical protein
MARSIELPHKLRRRLIKIATEVAMAIRRISPAIMTEPNSAEATGGRYRRSVVSIRLWAYMRGDGCAAPITAALPKHQFGVGA